MKITGISIDNFLGARRIRLLPEAPVIAITGPNGAGKSSINEAVRLALGDSILRVELKRDYPLLVSDGAKEAAIEIATDRGNAFYQLPKGQQGLDGELATDNLDALPLVLNAQAFASMNLVARRAFLFGLTKSTASPATVKALLLEKGHAAEKIEVVLPMLKSGFPAAEKLAADKATEARGAWKALTGEAYGSKKADSWEAPKLEVDLEALATLRAAKAAAEDKLAAAEQALGAVKANAEQAERANRQFTADQREAAMLGQTAESLAASRAAVAQHEKAIATLEPQAGDGPKQGLVHDMARFINGFGQGLVLSEADQGAAEELIGRYEMEFGPIGAHGNPEAKAKLIEARRKLAAERENVAFFEAALAKQKNAAERVKEAGAMTVLPDASALIAARDAAKAERDAVAVKLNQAEQTEQQAASADTRTATAKRNHEDALAWAALAEALSPEGIPAQILAKALKPINKLLQEAAVETSWKQVRIEPDMNIRADGRLYALLCESEKWRCDAMIAEAIAELSGIRILLLDRMDVLDLPGRAALLMWLSDRAEAGALSTAIVCGTMKAKPTGLPDTIAAYWLDDGTIEALETETV